MIHSESAVDVIRAPVKCRIEEMIGRLLERGEHEHGIFHLGHTEAGDAEDFALVRHDVGK